MYERNSHSEAFFTEFWEQKQTLASKYFLILLIVINNKTPGLLHGGGGKPGTSLYKIFEKKITIETRRKYVKY
jgi:hypothetical protein